MPINDIVIVLAVIISVVIGLVRGFIKEAISLAALLFAIWAALYFGPAVGNLSASWLSAEELQVWFGRVLVFAVILSIGGVVGWGLAKLVRLSILSGMDRFLGSLFGFCRGVLLIAVAIIGAEFSDIDEAGWWKSSILIPHFEVVAEWIRVMAPQGYDIITPDKAAESLPLPNELFTPDGD